MKFRVTFLPVFEPLHVDSTIPIAEQTDSHLSEVSGILKTAMEDTNELIQEESNTLGIVIGHEDFFSSGGKYIRGIPQEQGLTYFVKELAKLSEGYPNILLIPGTIYLSADKVTVDCKPYRQNKSKNYSPTLYVQNISPVFYQGRLIRLIKKGDYLESIIRTQKSILAHKPLRSEGSFVEALTSNCERLEVATYAEDELEHLIPRVVMFGKTPLPGEAALLSQLGLTSRNLFSPKFTIKGIQFGLEICADHQKAALGKKDRVVGLDIHMITSFGQVPVYDGTDGKGFLIRADHDSSTILNMSENERPLDINEPFELLKRSPSMNTLFPQPIESTSSSEQTSTSASDDDSQDFKAT